MSTDPIDDLELDDLANEANDIATLRNKNRELENEVYRLRMAIANYIEKPGCNAATRANAIRKLAWTIGIEMQ